MATIFIHGIGRAGRAAWPQQAASRISASDFVFLERVTPGDDPQQVADQALAELTAPGRVVAHSYGAIAALLLARQHPEAVSNLILFEPAALGVAADRPAVAAHIAAMAPVFAHRLDPAVSAAEFSARFAAASHRPVPDLPADELERNIVRLRATVPPWEPVVDPTVVSRIPTLVLTGGDEGMYAEVATALAESGAEHLTLTDSGHRPQDHHDAMPVMRRFWRHGTVSP